MPAQNRAITLIPTCTPAQKFTRTCQSGHERIYLFNTLPLFEVSTAILSLFRKEPKYVLQIFGRIDGVTFEGRDGRTDTISVLEPT